MRKVPSSWDDVPLAALLAEPLANGRSVPDGDGFPVLRLSALREDALDLSEHKSGSWTEKEAEPFLVKGGDLLVARGNGSLRLVGRARLVPSNPPRVAFPDTMIRVRPRADVVAPRFLAIQWDAPRTRSQVERAARTTAGIYKVSQGDLRDVRFVVPPLVEQERIVAVADTHFSRLDATVASLTRAKANLKRARASVLKAAVEGRLVPTEAALARAEGRDYEPASVLLGRILAERKAAWAASGARGKYAEPVAPAIAGRHELPEGWCWASVDQLGDEPLSNGKSVPSQDDGFPVLRLTAMENGRINFAEAKGGAWNREDAANWLVEQGDFFIMRGNGSLNRVGSAAIAGEPPLDVAFPDTMIRLRPVKSLVDPRYLLAAWSSHGLREQIEASARTTAGIHKVNQGSIATYVVPLPPPPEQRRIVAEVDRRLSVLDALDASVDANLARCARLRQSILKRAFEGRLVPTEHGGHP